MQRVELCPDLSSFSVQSFSQPILTRIKQLCLAYKGEINHDSDLRMNSHIETLQFEIKLILFKNKCKVIS